MNQRRDSFDVIVVGGSFGGVASAALLANSGYRVALVEHLRQVGGKHGGTNFNGYWINWGHRDALNGIGDMITAPLIHLYKAAGASFVVREGGFGQNVRIHSLPECTTHDATYSELMGMNVAGDDPLDGFRRRIRLYGGPVPDSEVEEGAIALKEVYEQLHATTDEQAWSLIHVDVGEWLRRNVSNPWARNALIANLEAFQSSPGEDGSIGRYIMFALKRPPRNLHASGPLTDPEVSGEQARLMPLVRRFRELGGELFLDWKPIEIVVEQPTGGSTCRVSGVICKNESNLIQELHAPIVVTDYFGWDLGKFLDESLLSPTFRERAQHVKSYATDLVAWWAGLNRLPRLRSTGETETFAGWNRILNGYGPAKEYHGGFHIPSLQYERTAPKGKHLFNINIGHQGGRYANWRTARAEMDLSIQYVKKFYLDLDDCIEWSRYQWVEAPQVQSWAFKPVIGHPVKVSSIEGLYCASASAEVASRSRDGAGVLSAAEGAAAMEAWTLIRQEYGHLGRTSS